MHSLPNPQLLKRLAQGRNQEKVYQETNEGAVKGMKWKFDLFLPAEIRSTIRL